MGSRHELPDGARLRVMTISGGVTVIAEERGDLEVDPEVRRVKIEDGHVAELKSRSKNFTVRCPIGTNVSVGSVSGSVNLEGSLGSIKVSTISSSVNIDTASGDVDVRTVSGISPSHPREQGSIGRNGQANGSRLTLRGGEDELVG